VPTQLRPEWIVGRYLGKRFLSAFCRLWESAGYGRLSRDSVTFLSGPVGAGTMARTLWRYFPPLFPALRATHSDRSSGRRRAAIAGNFPVLVRSMTAAALPFARSGFQVVITARKILKESAVRILSCYGRGIHICIDEQPRGRRVRLRTMEC
jgi:hypothetical protein